MKIHYLSNLVNPLGENFSKVRDIVAMLGSGMLGSGMLGAGVAVAGSNRSRPIPALLSV